MLSKKKLLIVVSAPSGTGKTTVVKGLLKVVKGLDRTVSTTTRKRKNGEVDGVDYYFISEKEFKDKIKKNEFIEYANVHGFFYGTSKKLLQNRYSKDLILNIDVQGGCIVKRKFPEAILIFLMPPSFNELENRLLKRRRDTKKEIRDRIKNAKMEIKYASNYDYIVVNDKLNDTIKKIKQIIISERRR